MRSNRTVLLLAFASTPSATSCSTTGSTHPQDHSRSKSTCKAVLPSCCVVKKENESSQALASREMEGRSRQRDTIKTNSTRVEPRATALVRKSA